MNFNMTSLTISIEESDRGKDQSNFVWLNVLQDVLTKRVKMLLLQNKSGFLVTYTHSNIALEKKVKKLTENDKKLHTLTF